MKRIFLGTREIAGYYSRLSSALRAEGAQVQFVTLETHPFNYGGSEETRWTRLLKRATAGRATASRRLMVGKLFWVATQKLAVAGAFLHALIRHDVFIFGFGTTFLPWNADLWILRAFRKTVIVNMGHGSELRPPYVDGSHQSADGQILPDPAVYRSLARSHLRRLRRIERHANYVIGAPYNSQFSRKPMINAFAIGLPSPVSEVNSPVPAKPGLVRVVHAPSHPAVKGTPRIREAIASLRLQGHTIEFVEIQGRPHDEVLRELAGCDFVIDQIYSDTPMAGLAAEAATFGKPAVVGGYGLKELRRHVPSGMFPPSHLCHPDELEDAVEQLIVDGSYRRMLGEEARRFVTTVWSPAQVARRYLALIEKKVPSNWWFDPLETCYVEGCGQAAEQTKKTVRSVVEAYGVAGLAMEHRPDVQRALLEFAGLRWGGSDGGSGGKSLC